MKSRFTDILLLLLVVRSIYGQDFKSASPKDIALFPQQNEFRNTLNLSGIWKFKKDTLGMGEKEGWFNGLKDSLPVLFREAGTTSLTTVTIIWTWPGMKQKPTFRVVGKAFEGFWQARRFSHFWPWNCVPCND